MKKNTLLFFLLVVLFGIGKVLAQSPISLEGNPVVTTGWTLGGTAVVVDSIIELTPPAANQTGFVTFNTALDVTTCGSFIADFDYNISESGPGTGPGSFGDGIAFFFENPASGYSGGGGLGLPNPSSGLVLTMDTYDNDGDFLNPENELFGYTTSTSYSEGDYADLLAPINGSQTYMTDGNWHHVRITYSAGNISVYFNGSTTASMTGYFPMSTSGYFGLSAATGFAYSLQLVRNVNITIGPVTPISGTPAACAGAGSTTSLSDITTGGTWSSGNTAVANIDATSGVVTGEALGTATISYAVTNSCGTGYVTQVVTVNIPVDAITGTAILCGGSSASLSDATAGGVWSSSNTAIATVDPISGTVYGAGGGSATIIYTADYCTATKAVAVAPPVPIAGQGMLIVNGTTSLSDASTGGTWTSSNIAIASVDPVSGVVTAGNAAGTDTITYTIGSCYVIFPMSIVPYCIPEYSYAAIDCYYGVFIKDFSFTGEAGTSLSDLGLGCSGTGYEDRTSIPPATIYTGNSYNITVGFGTYLYSSVMSS